MKILLTNVYDLFNKGEVALVTGLVKNLPDSEFIIASLYSFLNKELCRKWGIKIFGRINPRPAFLLLPWFILTLFRAFVWSLSHKLLNINPDFLLNKELKAYLGADLIIDLGGDNFSDETGFGGSLVHIYSLLPALLFNKPFVICSQSIGPFKTHFTRVLAKFILNRAKLITVREPITFRYLVNDLRIRVGEHLHLIPDLAFLLEETEHDEVKKLLIERGIPFNGKSIISVNPSQLISKYMLFEKSDRYGHYIDLMADIIDCLPNNTTVILIPNVIGRPVQIRGPFKNVDDQLAIEAIYEKVKDKSRVYIINGDVDAHQTKGIIGLSDLFIGCRMHAVISALSVGTPTIGLSYSHKTMGIVGELLGFKEFVVDVRHQSDPNALRRELLAKINSVWKNRLSIKEMLQERSEEWKLGAMMNINLIRQVV